MAILGIIGWLILVVGIIWMVVTAIQTGQTTGEKALWGIVCLVCGVLGGIIFFAVKRQGMVPLLLEIAGVILMYAGGGMAFYSGGMPTTP